MRQDEDKLSDTNEVQSTGSTPGTKKPVVLLVEDDPLLVTMYSAKFESEGFEVLTAYDGEEGLKVALEKNPNIILLDIMMPKLSGIDLLEKLRQDPKGKNTPVIILTNLTEAEGAEKAKELGVKEFLVKSNFTPSEVTEKIKQHLGR